MITKVINYIRRRGASIPYYAVNPIKSDFRKAFGYFLYGDGIEIGALHQPLSLRGTRVRHIQYVDRMPVVQLRNHYPELSSYELVQVDIIDNGETLSAINENSLDFIIANHFIEHTRNPIGTIQTWISKLRVGGIIYMAIPDKRYTFDVGRPLTKIEHLIEDAQLSDEARREIDIEHYREYAACVDKKTGHEYEQHVKNLVSSDYSIHFHTFIGECFVELIKYLQMGKKGSLSLVGYADTVKGNDEFIVILSKGGLTFDS